MLDFAPEQYGDGAILYSTNHAAYPPAVPQPAHFLPFPAKSPSSSPKYSPASVHAFDPFAEDSSDETASSCGSESSRVELHRQREQLHRVAAWVSSGSPSGLNMVQQCQQVLPLQPTPYTPLPMDTYYHTRSPSSTTMSSSAFSDEEPYVIYSTPLPGAPPAPTSASPSAPPVPARALGPIAPPRRQHGQAKSLSVPGPAHGQRGGGNVGVPVHLPHRRYVSLCSIREEDEPRV